jgi:hypothetical protein
VLTRSISAQILGVEWSPEEVSISVYNPTTKIAYEDVLHGNKKNSSYKLDPL